MNYYLANGVSLGLLVNTCMGMYNPEYSIFFRGKRLTPENERKRMAEMPDTIKPKGMTSIEFDSIALGARSMLIPPRCS